MYSPVFWLHRDIRSARSPWSGGSDFFEQPRQAYPQPLADLFDVHQGHIPDAPLDAAVVRPVHSAPLRSLFLIDPLLLPYTADGAAKPNADIERHRLPS